MASLFSFGIHIFVFNELWDYILQGKSIIGYTKEELIWYIIVAEFIIYSFETTYKKIATMVKQGDIASMLIKPIDVITYFSVCCHTLPPFGWLCDPSHSYAGHSCAIAVGRVVSAPLPGLRL